MIVPTRRLFAVALAGLVLVLLTQTYSAALVVGGLWLVGATALGVADSYFVPDAGVLRWGRDHDSKLSLGAWNRISVRLENLGDRPVTLRLRDADPTLLVPRGNSAAATCRGRSQWLLEYSIFPVHRGDYSLGPLTVRYLGPLGLAWKQRSTATGDAVKVYPNLLAVKSYDALIRRGLLAELGLRNSRRWGEGTEFERLRSYQPDDEFRRINWKATARRGEPMVVDYQIERSQNIILAIDAGRLMSTKIPLPGTALEEGEEMIDPNLAGNISALAPPALTRLDYSLNAALLLAYVSQEYGDRVGLLAFTDRVTRFVAPRSGRRQFLVVIEELYNLEPEPTATDFAKATLYLATRNPRRSLIVFFTDLAETDSTRQLVRHVASLVPRHLPLVVTLRDPSIEKLACQPVVDSQSVYERAVARRLLDERARTLAELQGRGALTVDVTADKLTASVINKYLEVKARTSL